MSRRDVEFRSGGAGDLCRGWLYLPDAATPAPVIVMAHGLGAVKEMRLDAFAERFTDAGYACLVFDYRHFGASDGSPRQLLSIRRQLADWAAAIAHARSIPDVDGRRVVLWGTSFGGGHAMAAGARDGDVAAVIAQCPFTSGIASTLALHPISAIKVTARGVMDLAGSVLGRAPVTVGLAGEAGDAALMTAPDVIPGYLPLVPEGHPFSNEVAARVGLAIPLHHPGRSLQRITCPVLVCVCDDDTVAPPRPTVRYARRGPTTRLIRYPEGHFDIYVGDAFEEIVADQVDFLDRVVPLDAWDVSSG
ncbi:alpha/beta hydrolase [Gordonia sp. SL306]|uniref:alpha/beta hydrolase n=1 Tax=Gordonia sp. SL306 TaxID=2995145 RepID=UPI00226EEA23|nr:alpha/beta hydrolase [Gordonia sp. SL306]WAC57311.1 alpha/beta hydrolase [Gordonia sp. SL306]